MEIIVSFLPTEAIYKDVKNCLWNVSDCRNACRLGLALASPDVMEVHCKAREFFGSRDTALDAER